MSDEQAETQRQEKDNKLVMAAMLIPFSIIGTLIRISLTRLQQYEGAPVFSLVYAQWLGCFIMGVALKNKDCLHRYLYVAISSGLCGSITTFSSWQLDVFKAFVNYDRLPHTRGKNVLAGLSQLLVTLAMALTGLTLGQHLTMRWPRVPPIPRYGTVILCLCCWVGVLVAAVLTQDPLALACVFAPVGALMRWCLSFLNTRYSHFPVGTLMANVVGTSVLAVLTLVQPRSCLVIRALGDGYCGCLTTISTFMVELCSLPRKPSYLYGTISVVISQCAMFIILGSFIWTQGIPVSC